MSRLALSPRRGVLGAVAVVLAVLVLYIPQYFEEFRVAQFSSVIAISIAVLGLALLTGFNGQISVGHGAFFGVGAYTTAILTADHEWGHLSTIPVAMVLCFLLGVVVGLLIAVGLAKMAASILFGIQPTDPATFAGVTVVVLTVAIFAAWSPSLRARRVDPAGALRAD